MKCKKKESTEYHIVLTDEEHTYLIGLCDIVAGRNAYMYNYPQHVGFAKKLEECLCRAGEDIIFQYDIVR